MLPIEEPYPCLRGLTEKSIKQKAAQKMPVPQSISEKLKSEAWSKKDKSPTTANQIEYSAGVCFQNGFGISIALRTLANPAHFGS
jgi:hypothetical protein